MIVFYLLISLMPMDQDPFWGTFLGAGTLIKYVGLVCIVYAMFHLLVRRAMPRYFGTMQARLFLLFFLLSSASYWFWGPHFSLRASAFISYLSMVFLFFVVLTIVDSLSRLRLTLLTMIGAMGFTSLVVFREWMRDPMWRPGSIAGDANYFALSLCLIFPAALLILLRSRVLWERIFVLGCMVAMIVANTLGASRGGLFALAAAFLWLIWHSPRRLRNCAVIAILLIPPLLLYSDSPVRRLITPKPGDLNGEEARLIAWKAGLRMIQQHPLGGIGLGEFKPEMLNYTDNRNVTPTIGHNTYIEVAAETGLFNLFVFVALLFFTYRTLSRVRRETEAGPPLVHLAALGVQSGFVGCFVGIFFLSAEYEKVFWLWVFLAMALPALVTAPAEGRQKAGVYVLPGWKADVAAPAPERAGRAALAGVPDGGSYRVSSRGAPQLARHPGAVRKT